VKGKIYPEIILADYTKSAPIYLQHIYNIS